MKSPLFSLFWKEWHEHKWKLVAMCAVLCGSNALIYVSSHREFFDASYWLTLLTVVPLAVFVGASVASSERARSTQAFLSALPARSSTVAFIKLVAGLLTLILAIGFTFLLLRMYFYIRALDTSRGWDFLFRQQEVLLPPIQLGNWFASAAVSLIAVACSIYLWTVAAGVNRVDEVSAGARAVLVIAGWWTVLIAISYAANIPDEPQAPLKTIIASVFAISPAGVAVMFAGGQHTLVSFAGNWVPLIAAFVWHAALALLFVHGFRRENGSRARVAAAAQQHELSSYWPRPPFRSQLAAIAWKQWRETGHVVLAAQAGILVLTALIVAVNWRDLRVDSENIWNVGGIYVVMTAAFSTFVVLVAGIGVSLGDSSPNLNTFWRSRPIDPDRWYWSKYATSALVLVATLWLPALIIATAAKLSGYSRLWDALWDNGASVLIVSVLGVFSCAVATTVLVRQAVYSAILSIALIFSSYYAMLLAIAAARYVLLGVPLHVSFDDESRFTNPIVIIGMAIVAVAAAVLGWAATRYDWGRKSRY